MNSFVSFFVFVDCFCWKKIESEQSNKNVIWKIEKEDKYVHNARAHVRKNRNNNRNKNSLNTKQTK